jgi:hypothetical protein
MRIISIGAMMMIAAAGCRRASPSDTDELMHSPTPDTSHPAPTQSIGRATMDSDGTIVMDLRAEASGGTVGDARLVYHPGDKDYAMVLKHLGGLKPGETKPVPPFP